MKKISDLKIKAALEYPVLERTIILEDLSGRLSYRETRDTQEVLQWVNLELSKYIIQRHFGTEPEWLMTLRIPPHAPYWDVLVQFIRNEINSNRRFINVGRLFSHLMLGGSHIKDEELASVKTLEGVPVAQQLVLDTFNQLFGSLALGTSARLYMNNHNNFRALIDARSFRLAVKDYIRENSWEGQFRFFQILETLTFLNRFAIKHANAKTILCGNRLDIRKPNVKILGRMVRDILAGGIIEHVEDLEQITERSRDHLPRHLSIITMLGQFQQLTLRSSYPRLNDYRLEDHLLVYCSKTKTIFFLEAFLDEESNLTILDETYFNLISTSPAKTNIKDYYPHIIELFKGIRLKNLGEESHEATCVTIRKISSPTLSTLEPIPISTFYKMRSTYDSTLIEHMLEDVNRLAKFDVYPTEYREYKKRLDEYNDEVLYHFAPLIMNNVNRYVIYSDAKFRGDMLRIKKQ